MLAVAAVFAAVFEAADVAFVAPVFIMSVIIAIGAAFGVVPNPNDFIVIRTTLAVGAVAVIVTLAAIVTIVVTVVVGGGAAGGGGVVAVMIFVVAVAVFASVVRRCFCYHGCDGWCCCCRLRWRLHCCCC